MKRRQFSFLAFLWLLTAEGTTVPAIGQDQKFTCQVYGGSFVLDDTDFKVLAESGITRANFASLEPKRRAQVCDTRKLWRLIKEGKTGPCDFFGKKHFPNWLPELFGASEQETFITAQVDASIKHDTSKEICN